MKSPKLFGFNIQLWTWKEILKLNESSAKSVFIAVNKKKHVEKRIVDKMNVFEIELEK